MKEYKVRSKGSKKWHSVKAESPEEASLIYFSGDYKKKKKGLSLF